METDTANKLLNWLGDFSDRGPYIQISNGRIFYIADPQPHEVDIESIAYSLAGIARFTGHSRRRGDAIYSVAQHCCNVAEKLPPCLKLEGLLHDAAEFVTNDLAHPFKYYLKALERVVTRDHVREVPIKQIERVVDQAIRRCFQLPLEESPEVKTVDMRMVVSEQRALMPPGLEFGNAPPFYDDIDFTPWGSVKAEQKFLAAFRIYQQI